MAKSCDLDGVLYQLTAWFFGGSLLTWLFTGSFLAPLTAWASLAILRKVFANIEESGRPLPIFR